MRTSYTRSSRPLIPSYHENAAVQLVIANGITFIMFHFSRVIMMTMGISKEKVFEMMFPNIGLSSVAMFREKWWTVLTYGFAHHGFFDWFTNMIWLYCFGAVLQNLAGFKQVIPLFFYAILIGGGFYLGSEIIFTDVQQAGNDYFLGAQSGVIALGIAAFTFAPRYRLHVSENFSIPMALIIGIYIVLDLIVYIPDQVHVLSLCAGGALTGFIFAMLLRAGYRPGEWVYNILGKMQRIATPDEAAIHERKTKKRMDILRQIYDAKKGVSQQNIDEILDKINAKGYDSLSSEEKDMLFRAGSQNHVDSKNSVNKDND